MKQKVTYWVFGRNDSWWESAKIGLGVGLWFFPTSIVENLKLPFITMLQAIYWFLSSVILLIWHHTWMTIAGVFGFVTELEIEVDEENQNPT